MPSIRNNKQNKAVEATPLRSVPHLDRSAEEKMEREITDGDHKIGRSPVLRLIRALAVFAILGVLVALRWSSDMVPTNKVLLIAGIVALALPTWRYLEVRNLLICRAQESRSLRWRVAAFSLHPAMLPVYFIALPIIVYLSLAWFRHQQAEQGGGGNSATLRASP